MGLNIIIDTTKLYQSSLANFFKIFILGLFINAIDLNTSIANDNLKVQSDTTNAFATVNTAQKTSVIKSDAKVANSSQQIIDQPDDFGEYIEHSVEDLTNKLDISDDDSDQNTSDLENEQNLPARAIFANSELSGEYHEAYYKLNSFNKGLPQLSTSPNLETPLATIEFFNSASLNNDYILASYALNLNGLSESEQANQAEQLAQKLDYLLNKKSLYIFEELPDRPDGLVKPALGESSPIQGIPRRSIKLGEIDYKQRQVPIFLQRIKIDNQPPIWVFSSQTVSSIDALYDIHKPAKFEQYLPSSLKAEVFGISVWEMLALIAMLLLTLVIGFIMSSGVAKLVTFYSNKKLKDKEHQQLSLRNKSITDLISKLVVPLTISISFTLLFAFVSGSLPKVDAIATSMRPILWFCLILSWLWLGIRVINFFANRYQDYRIDSLGEKEFNIQRKRMTYVSIFRRIFIFVMVLGGLWISLAEFTDLESLGTTLLTSAGIAGAVIGIAAQPTLGNIIAGFQVALTQPVRIGDTVIMEGVWCEVEDLRYTYAVLKTWDDRRLIVPMKELVTDVIENWSHTSTDQSMPVYLYVDYGADIDAISEKFLELTKSHELVNLEIEPEVLVTEVSEDTITLRGKVSSDGPMNAWALACDVRKQMLNYLNEEHYYTLPTERVTLTSRGNTK